MVHCSGAKKVESKKQINVKKTYKKQTKKKCIIHH